MPGFGHATLHRTHEDAQAIVCRQVYEQTQAARRELDTASGNHMVDANTDERLCSA